MKESERTKFHASHRERRTSTSAMPPHIKRRTGGYYYLVDGDLVKSLKTKTKRYAEARLQQYKDGKFLVKQDTKGFLVRGFLNDFRSPCVYIVSRYGSGEVLYVGSSERGIARPFLPGHHALKDLTDPDIRIEIRDFPTVVIARTEEERLIRDLNPKLNRQFRPLSSRVDGALGERPAFTLGADEDQMERMREIVEKMAEPDADKDF